MSELSQDDVFGVFGRPVSAALVAEIIATGISKAELETAYRRVVSDRQNHRSSAPLQPGRESEVVEILERLHSQGVFGEGGSRLV
jgi:hypothetical protein